MLSDKQIQKIREHLDAAQNPVFFFDNDNDGLISFVLLRRFIGRGKGVAIKSFPELDESYVRKIDELGADSVFILDKPLVSDVFFEECKKRNLPVVWIDHHEVEVKKPDFVDYYNSFPDGEPVSYLAYKIGRKEDDWLAMIGCISDNFLPDFAKGFEKKFPEIWKKDPESAFEVFYDTEFGKMANIIDFGLKDRTTNVLALINFLIKVSSPFDILREDDKNFKIYQRYLKVKASYDKILDKAKRVARRQSKLIFFQYGGDLSLSANLANELSYRFPGKIILVVFVKGAVANVSVRGKIDVRKITLKAVGEIDGAMGGGHKYATGARLPISELNKFRRYFEEAVK